MICDSANGAVEQGSVGFPMLQHSMPPSEDFTNGVTLSRGLHRVIPTERYTATIVQENPPFPHLSLAGGSPVSVQSPLDGHALFAAVAVVIFDEAILGSEFVDALGDFDVEGAVFSDLGELALLPPADSF